MEQQILLSFQDIYQLSLTTSDNSYSVLLPLYSFLHYIETTSKTSSTTSTIVSVAVLSFIDTNSLDRGYKMFLSTLLAFDMSCEC